METKQYSRGKNPNSLKNLQKGRPYKSKEEAAAAAVKRAEIQRVRRYMKDVIDDILNEEREVTLPDGSKITTTKLEAILKNWTTKITKDPTYKDILALQKILGEDVQQVEIKQEEKYKDIDVTDEDVMRAMAVLNIKHEKLKLK